MKRQDRMLIACKSGKLDILKQILSQDHFVEENVLNYKDSNGNTPFIWACQKGYSDIAKLLLSGVGTNLNTSNDNGSTALMFACQNGYIEIVKLFLQHSGVFKVVKWI